MSERGKYTTNLEALFNEWNAEFDKMETSTVKHGADPAVEYGDVIASLRNSRLNSGNSATKRNQAGGVP